ncbi:MAG: hypothetical protein HOI95_08855 [Chromatiales bacterium]|nr:hypothetical protein [Chromatiales bacterium]
MQLIVLASPIAVLIFSVLGFGMMASVHACGATSDCVIGARIYRIRMPATQADDTKVGAIVFAHGYQGSAKGVMCNKGLAQVATKLGVAYVCRGRQVVAWSYGYQ